MTYLSHVTPDKIVFCLKSALERHVAYGFSCKKSISIKNGVNCESFLPNSNDHREMPSNLKINDDALVVGLAGRFHQDKGYEDFIKAAGIVHERLESSVKF